ncbi:hypothetical protein [Micromonospora sp. NPDC005220]|uniref:hypothetical protein n=1 Tax=Micromonospora sp. NPDC005220 TaxID=3155589 RepID=UPI0033AAAE44
MPPEPVAGGDSRPAACHHTDQSISHRKGPATPGTTATRTGYRTCPLCEATCGLTLTIADDRVTDARGDREHVFSHGFVCPKGPRLATTARHA